MWDLRRPDGGVILVKPDLTPASDLFRALAERSRSSPRTILPEERPRCDLLASPPTRRSPGLQGRGRSHGRGLTDDTGGGERRPGLVKNARPQLGRIRTARAQTLGGAVHSPRFAGPKRVEALDAIGVRPLRRKRVPIYNPAFKKIPVR